MLDEVIESRMSASTISVLSIRKRTDRPEIVMLSQRPLKSVGSTKQLWREQNPLYQNENDDSALRNSGSTRSILPLRINAL